MGQKIEPRFGVVVGCKSMAGAQPLPLTFVVGSRKLSQKLTPLFGPLGRTKKVRHILVTFFGPNGEGQKFGLSQRLVQLWSKTFFEICCRRDLKKKLHVGFVWVALDQLLAQPL